MNFKGNARELFEDMGDRPMGEHRGHMGATEGTHGDTWGHMGTDPMCMCACVCTKKWSMI